MRGAASLGKAPFESSQRLKAAEEQKGRPHDVRKTQTEFA